MFLKFFITYALICCSFAQDDPVTTTKPEPETTTTEEPTTTTTLAPITTEKPVKYHFYNVTKNDVTCIMIDGNFTFKVEYSIGPNKTNVTELRVPQPSSEVNVSGSCDDGGKQHIIISWGKSVMFSSLKIYFSSSKDDKWTVDNITSSIYMDESTFPNGTDNGKTLKSVIPFNLSPSEVPFNNSFTCFSSLTFDKFNTTEDNIPYPHHLELHVNKIRLQAFNTIPKTEDFVKSINCDADKIADIVPIAVGCALAALIFVVLVAYVIGRRRRSASYQSV